jgi:hypothetical protein
MVSESRIFSHDEIDNQTHDRKKQCSNEYKQSVFVAFAAFASVPIGPDTGEDI